MKNIGNINSTSSAKSARVGLLDKFVLQELLGPFLFGIMAFTVILVAGDLLFRIADLIIQRGVSLGVVIRLFLYRLPGVIVLTIPMGALLAALLGFGRMSSNVEIVALKASGVSFQRIVRPVILAALFVSMLSLVLNETIVPITEKAATNLLRYEVFRSSPPLFREKMFFKEESGGELRRVIYIGKLRPRSAKMEDILIQEFDGGRLSRVIAAEKGEWVDGEWWMEDGKIFDVDNAANVKLLFTFKRQGMRFSLTPAQLETNSMDPEKMNIMDMYATIKSLAAQGADVTRLWVIFNLRLAVPWASVVLAIVGAATGCRPTRSSSGMGLGLSVIIVFCYYVILSFCQSLGEASYLPPLLAAWFANIVFLILGGYLVKRAN